MVSEAIYERVRELVKQELSCSAHDLEHVFRVYRLCLRLAEELPRVDLEVLRLAALLHDIARAQEDSDNTGKTDHALLGAALAETILRELTLPEAKIAAVKDCIITHRFRSNNPPRSLEAKILFDADKLDVLGAIGVTRSYIICGQYKEAIYSEVPLEQYVKDNLVGGTIDGRVKDISKHASNLEFEIKLKRIPERLFTEKAKQLALSRVKFMEEFFTRLAKELQGEC